MSDVKDESPAAETPAVVVGQKRSNSESGGPASKKPNTGDPEGMNLKMFLEIMLFQFKSRFSFRPELLEL